QQQFVLGGLSTMSAYLPGTLIGDSGVYGRIKLEGHWHPFGADLTPSLFVEYGTAWFEDVRGELGESRSLVDAGVRVEGDIGRDLTMQFVAAVPVSERNLDSDLIKTMEANFYWHLEKRF
ncbi:MAG: hemolysin activation/secretion protein, partial [Bacteroidia bacterium]